MQTRSTRRRGARQGDARDAGERRAEEEEQGLITTTTIELSRELARPGKRQREL